MYVALLIVLLAFAFCIGLKHAGGFSAYRKGDEEGLKMYQRGEPMPNFSNTDYGAGMINGWCKGQEQVHEHIN
jgi:hypothetical protein